MTISDWVADGLWRRARCVGVLVVAVGALCTTPAAGETDEQKAVTLFEKGRKLARDGHCAEAIAPLLESVRYAEGVGALLNLGNCYETLGKPASAHRSFVRAEEIAAARDDRRRDEAATRARGVERDLPMLIVHVPTSLRSAAEVRVDGEVWPRDRWDTPTPIDPGSHGIEVLAPPRPKVTDTILVRGKGERVEWTLPTPDASRSPDAARAAPDEAGTRRAILESPSRADSPTGAGATSTTTSSSSQRTFGLVTGGVGLGGLVAGAIFGVISISAHSSVVGRCASYPKCALSDRRALDDMNDRAETTGTVSTIAIVAGAILVATGASLFFTSKSSTP